MAIPESLEALLRAHGPAGHEHLAFDAVRAAAGDAATVTSDSIGNLVVRREGEGPLLALFAHLDVIGLAISHVGDEPLLPVHLLGSWRASVAYAQRVVVRTADGDVPGVIARRTRDGEKVEWDQLYVDIGARDGEDARDLVAPGDPIVLDAPPLELANRRVASRGLDNRASVHVALEAFKALEGRNVAVVCAAQEELGAQGAQAAAHALRPDVAVALDVTYATDVPADSPSTGGHHALGGGPAIFRGPAINPHVFRLLREAADREGIEHTVETGAKTYTDADVAFASREGIPTGLVSVPLRNMHSAVELVDLADLEACTRLLVAFARSLEPGASYAR